jgi:hypothetical protein
MKTPSSTHTSLLHILRLGDLLIRIRTRRSLLLSPLWFTAPLAGAVVMVTPISMVMAVGIWLSAAAVAFARPCGAVVWFAI